MNHAAGSSKAEEDQGVLISLVLRAGSIKRKINPKPHCVMLLTGLLWGGSRDIAYLILDEELDSLNWSSSGFRDRSRHTTHYNKPSVNQNLFHVCNWRSILVLAAIVQLFRGFGRICVCLDDLSYILKKSTTKPYYHKLC